MIDPSVPADTRRQADEAPPLVQAQCCEKYLHKPPKQAFHAADGGEWESNPPGTLLSPTLVLKTRGATRLPVASR